MFNAIVWKKHLTKDEQDRYRDLFFRLQTRNVSVDPTLLAVLRKETDRELEVAFQDPAAKFVIFENVVSGMIACITVYERSKYVSIRHFAAVDCAPYTVQELAKKLLVNIQLEYPKTPYYGICQKSDVNSIHFYQDLLKCEIGRYFFQSEHPEKRIEDGWVGISTGQIEA